MPGSQKGLYSHNTASARECYHQKRGMQIASDAKPAEIIWKSLQFKQQNSPNRTQEPFTFQGSTIHNQIMQLIFCEQLKELQVRKLKCLLNVPDDSDQCYTTFRVISLKSPSHLLHMHIYFIRIHIHTLSHKRIHSIQYKNKPSHSGSISGFQEHLFLWRLQYSGCGSFTKNKSSELCQVI